MIKFTLSSNAGFALQLGDKRILVDAFGVDAGEFDGLDEKLKEEVFKAPSFINPDFVLFTHCHPDHFSYDYTDEFIKRFPQAKLFLPEKKFENQTLVEGRKQSFTFDAIEIIFYELPHEKEETLGVPHYVIEIKYEGKSIVFTGDCAVACDKFSSLFNGKIIDIFVVDFPWITLNGSLNYVKNILKPKNILVCHLPWKNPDNRYLNITNKVVEKKLNEINTNVLYKPFSEISYQ